MIWGMRSMHSFTHCEPTIKFSWTFSWPTLTCIVDILYLLWTCKGIFYMWPTILQLILCTNSRLHIIIEVKVSLIIFWAWFALYSCDVILFIGDPRSLYLKLRSHLQLKFLIVKGLEVLHLEIIFGSISCPGC